MLVFISARIGMELLCAEYSLGVLSGRTMAAQEVEYSLSSENRFSRSWSVSMEKGFRPLGQGTWALLAQVFIWPLLGGKEMESGSGRQWLDSRENTHWITQALCVGLCKTYFLIIMQSSFDFQCFMKEEWKCIKVKLLLKIISRLSWTKLRSKFTIPCCLS